MIAMELASDTVDEDGGTISVCAEITALPIGGLEIDLVVTLFTSGNVKTGLYYREGAVVPSLTLTTVSPLPTIYSAEC